MNYLENFNALKSQAKNYFKSIKGKRDADNTDFSLQEIKSIVIHGFESSQMLNLLQEFIGNTPITQSRSSKMLIDRFIENYAFLGLYTITLLPAISIVDFLLGVSTIPDNCVNTFNMITNLFQKDESAVHNVLPKGIPGYYDSLKAIISTMALFNSTRSLTSDVRNLILNQCHTFGFEHEMKEENAFECLKEIDILSNDLKRIILHFDEFHGLSGNILNKVFNYAVNVDLLLNSKHKQLNQVHSAEMQERLENTDVFSLIGDKCFNTNISLTNLESMACNINANLIYTICVNFGQRFEETENEDSAIDFVRTHNELIAHILSDFTVKADKDNPNSNQQLFQNLFKTDEFQTVTSVESDVHRSTTFLALDYFDSIKLQKLQRQDEHW